MEQSFMQKTLIIKYENIPKCILSSMIKIKVHYDCVEPHEMQTF